MYNVCIYADRVKVNKNVDIVISVLAESRNDVPEPETPQKWELQTGKEDISAEKICLSIIHPIVIDYCVHYFVHAFLFV